MKETIRLNKEIYDQLNMIAESRKVSLENIIMELIENNFMFKTIDENTEPIVNIVKPKFDNIVKPFMGRLICCF